MSRKPFKSQASSARAATGSTFGGFGAAPASTPFAAAGAVSSLSYLAEPPDLGEIADSNLVVAFKNLNKKDSTTKSKALEDIQTSLTSIPEPQDAVLEAWTSVFPRTSIDAARRVRQLAHNVQGSIASKSGKRVAKHMPKIAGAWLAGLYDNDKTVAKAAQDALLQVFTTGAKIQALRKAYQEQILLFASGVLENESPQTLSDERTISPDEALAKYSRAVVASIGLLTSLFTHLTREDREKYATTYETVLESKKFWELAVHSDSAVRRAMHKFLKVYLQSDHEISDATSGILSTIYVYKGLDSDQSSSSTDYVDALSDLTKAIPDVWTTHYTGKKSADTRLRHFVKKGSQGATANYWSNVATLFGQIPPQILPTDAKSSEELLGALYSGMTRKEEPRSYLGASLKAYFAILSTVVERVADTERSTLVQQIAVPFVKEYAEPISQSSKHALPATRETPVLLEGLLKIPGIDTVLSTELPVITSTFTDDLKKSLPEQSKDHAATQAMLLDRGKRTTTLLSVISRSSPSGDLQAAVGKAATDLIDACMQICKSRNGKPYSAAETLAAVFEQKDIMNEAHVQLDTVDEFVENNASMLIVSPSGKALARILVAQQKRPASRRAAIAAAKTLTQSASPGETRHNTLLCTLLDIEFSDEERSQLEPMATEYVQSLVTVALSATPNSTAQGDAWRDVGAVLKNSSILSSALDETLSSLISGLGLQESKERIVSALNGLISLAKNTPKSLGSFAASPKGQDLLPRILLLTEANDQEVADLAAELSNVLQSASISSGAASSNSSIRSVVKTGLSSASATSVSVATLVQQTKQLLDAKPAEDAINDVLPDRNLWLQQLQPFFRVKPDQALSITHSLGGAISLLDLGNADTAGSGAEQTSRDGQGLSVPMRLLFYTIQLLQIAGSAEDLEEKLISQILLPMILTLQLANDNLSVRGSNGIWSITTQAMEQDVVEMIAQGQKLAADYTERSGSLNIKEGTIQSSSSAVLTAALEAMQSKAGVNSTEGYYNALAYCQVVSWNLERHATTDSSYAKSLDDQLRLVRKSGSLLQYLAFIASHKSLLTTSSLAHRICNETVADLTGLGGTRDMSKVPRQLVILNAFIQDSPETANSIAKQRLVFIVKADVDLLKGGELAVSSQAEICKTLTVLMSRMSETYGEYWADVLNYIVSTWMAIGVSAEEPSLVLLHASLKLLASLRSLKSEPEANEDLVEAWAEREGQINTAMLRAIQLLSSIPDEENQPARIVSQLVTRQLSHIPSKEIKSTDDLYPVLTSQSICLQEAAYDLLHKVVPAQQEQVSFDAALENKTARLPMELLSLILDAPVEQDVDLEVFDQSVPLQLRAYCFSWLLVFDHFENASYKVKSDYLDHLKEGDYLTGLLDFTFDFLGHTRAKPIDASKFDITRYSVNDLDPPLRDYQWLLIHIYYLCLTHVPSLAKAWWVDCRPRQKSLAVESWTEKFISPHIVAQALEKVNVWSQDQLASGTGDDLKPLTVKISPRAAELTASYPVDESSCAIRISLPSTFPLHQARVESLSRVAIDERHWQSWLRITQGVIAFSNNNIVDGLVTWRRNVAGALKGQIECAICYSIVAEDGKLPSKKCRTCKNLFHGGCLFKWFRSSGGATCPLCRSAFNYG